MPTYVAGLPTAAVSRYRAIDMRRLTNGTVPTKNRNVALGRDRSPMNYLLRTRAPVGQENWQLGRVDGAAGASDPMRAHASKRANGLEPSTFSLEG